MEQMMELERRCCSAEDKCAEVAEEVMKVGAQYKILIEKLAESNTCLSDARTKNLESLFEEARSENPRFSQSAKDLINEMECAWFDRK